MKNLFLYLFTLIALLPVISAKSLTGGESSKNFDSCVIRIFSPYGCYQEVRVNVNGSGVMKTGHYSGDIESENISADSIYVSEWFRVGKTQDLKKIREAIADIQKEKIKGVFRHDAYRFQILIDKEERLDVYGNTGNVDKICRVLLKYMPKRKDNCDFLKQYQKNR